MDAPTACRRTVSGSLSTFLSKCFSPFPHGTGSLSVSSEYLALPDGPGGFAQNSSCSALLRIPLCLLLLRIRVCHPLWRQFPLSSPHVHSTTARSYNPIVALLPLWFGLFPVRSPLLGESFIYFLFLEVLRCFSSLGWRPAMRGRAEALGCPIRISPDQWLFAPTRSLSQLITSFIAWMSLGIHRSPFLTFDNSHIRQLP